MAKSQKSGISITQSLLLTVLPYLPQNNCFWGWEILRIGENSYSAMTVFQNQRWLPIMANGTCQYYIYVKGQYPGLPAVREKSGKIFIFQGQGKVREFCEKSGKVFEWRKVREKSGNFVMNARNIFYGSRHAFVPHLSASYESRLHKSLICFDAMWYFPPITVSREENMCLLLTVYWLIIPSKYFASLINFHLLYCEGKSVTVSLEILSVFGQWNFEKRNL